MSGAVQVFRFRAGQVGAAVAARGVTAIVGCRDEYPHVAGLLGRTDRGPQAGQRALRLSGEDGDAVIVVDGPIGLEEIAAERLLRCPVGLPRSTSNVILGFARREDQLLLLLAISPLVRLACAGPQT